MKKEQLHRVKNKAKQRFFCWFFLISYNNCSVRHCLLLFKFLPFPLPCLTNTITFFESHSPTFSLHWVRAPIFCLFLNFHRFPNPKQQNKPYTILFLSRIHILSSSKSPSYFSIFHNHKRFIHSKMSRVFFILILQSIFHLSRSQPFIGVNYGQVADNLPAPAATAKLLQSTSIQKVRLYGSDPAIINALANTGIGIVVGVSNGDIPGLASDPNAARGWVNANVAAYHPASDVIMIMAGNEVYYAGDQNLKTQLAPAMRNLQSALAGAGLAGKVKVATVNAMTVLQQSEPPSSGRFDPGVSDLLKAQLEFLNATGSPFAINPYPFFAYQSDPRPETLAFCLFQPNAGRFDPGTNIKYTNMFDAQVDAVRSALDKMGFKGVEIVVAETGWPYKGDSNEVGPSLDNAKAYVGNLISHLRSMVGTPLMPGKSVDTYLFALYDEDLKPGPTSERSFGLFKPDLTMTYDAGLSKSSSQDPSSKPRTSSPPASSQPKPSGGWCLPKNGVSNAQLQANLDYACGQGIDCSPIQPGGACFEPNTIASHAAYAMNLFYQTSEKNPWNCDFAQTAVLSSTNPSYNGCVYQGGST